MSLDRIAAGWFIRAAVSTMVDCDDLVGSGEGEDLEIPDIATGGPRMEKNDRRAFAVSVEEDFDSAIVSVGHRNYLTKYWAIF